MAWEVKLDAFEGPLDLLLALIRKNQVSIYDIPVAEIADQYIACLESMDHEDLDRTSEFLVLAATLLDIKARMLLPGREKKEEDPREELVGQLVEYRRMRLLSERLRDRAAVGEQIFCAPPRLPEEVKKARIRTDLNEQLKNVTVRHLHDLYAEVLHRREDLTAVRDPRPGRIVRGTIPLSEQILRVRRSLAGGRSCSFAALLSRRAGRSEVVVTFLAVLEMLRRGEISLTGDRAEEMTVRGREDLS